MKGVISPSVSAGSSQRFTSVTCTPMVRVPSWAAGAGATADTSRINTVSRHSTNGERTRIEPPPDERSDFGSAHGGGASSRSQASGWPFSPRRRNLPGQVDDPDPTATEETAMPKIKHIALATQDVDKSAKFYIDVFDMKEVAKIDSPGARGYFL